MAPQFNPNIRELSTEQGAEALAAMIAKYWRARGFQVETHTTKEIGARSADMGIWAVRSDLVNGYPASYRRPGFFLPSAPADDERSDMAPRLRRSAPSSSWEVGRRA